MMDSKISYLYKTMDSEQLMSLDYDKVLSLFSDDEKEVLATKHWIFDEYSRYRIGYAKR
ncbi:MAG: hypothetical protein IPJ37_24170 [Bacteroidales bacterium]|nr:hypothetical protein [Bacteroidales bacterium]